MPHGKQIGLRDRQRVFELASQGLSVRQIAERMGVSFLAAKRALAKGLLRCPQCGRVSDSGDLCPVCSLPVEAPFYDRLKAFRRIAGLSQMSLALTIGVDESRVRNWEKGRKQPAEHEVKTLAEALGLTMRELTGSAEPEKGG
jgi:transcriptional regulator with XRE-family HTH domain